MIFIDRAIPRSVARALQQVRSDVRWLEDHFPHNVADPVWLEHCGREGWLVVSRDKRLRSRPAERRAMVQWSVGAFVITVREHLSRWQTLHLVVIHLDEMERRFASEPRPFLHTVSRTGLARYDLRAP